MHVRLCFQGPRSQCSPLVQLRRLSTKSDMQATVKSAVAELRNIADQKVAGNELQSLK